MLVEPGQAFAALERLLDFPARPGRPRVVGQGHRAGVVAHRLDKQVIDGYRRYAESVTPTTARACERAGVVEMRMAEQRWGGPGCPHLPESWSAQRTAIFPSRMLSMCN